MPSEQPETHIVRLEIEINTDDISTLQDLETPANDAVNRAKSGNADIYLFAATHDGQGDRLTYVQARASSMRALLHMEQAKKQIDSCRDLQVSDRSAFASMYKDKRYSLPLTLNFLPLLFGDPASTFYGWVAVSGSTPQISHETAFLYACRFWEINKEPH